MQQKGQGVEDGATLTFKPNKPNNNRYGPLVGGRRAANNKMLGTAARSATHAKRCMLAGAVAPAAHEIAEHATSAVAVDHIRAQAQHTSWAQARVWLQACTKRCAQGRGASLAYSSQSQPRRATCVTIPLGTGGLSSHLQ